MSRKFSFLLSTCAILFLTSCQKEISYETGTNPGNGGGGGGATNKIRNTLKILVLNENGQIFSNAKVESGTTTVYTNQFGIAEFKDVMVVANKAMVKVTVPGYFTAYRTFLANGKECFGKIKLQKYTFTATVDQSGGDAQISPELTISFPADAFVNPDGTPYNGTALIYGTYLNPEANDFDLLMPGTLLGEDNGDVALKSFGMTNIEILAGPGLPLKLKAGKQATIKAKIPASLLTDAPATIPMWYFDTDKGVWIKEGNGTRQGDTYIGNVSHFTWWNYDFAYPRIYISGKLTDPSGNPIVNTTVISSVIAYRFKFYTITNSEGYFRVVSPPVATSSLGFFGPLCNVPFYTTSVNANGADIDLGTIVATSFTQQRFNVNGNFQNCNSQPVQTGSLKVFTQNNMFEGSINNGAANISFSFCNDSLDVLLVAVDFTTGKVFTSSRRLYKDVPVNIGTQSVCSSTDQFYIRYIVDNQLYYISGNAIDRLTSHFFNFGSPWVQVAHNNYSNPLQLTSKIYFNTDIGGYVTTMIISDYPNLSNVGGFRELTNYFDNYSSTPGVINKGTLSGRQFDTGTNQWRFISVAYSVEQQ